MIPQPKEIENIEQKISALEQKIDDINKDNIYKMFLKPISDDLNNEVEPNIILYNPNTLNSPYKQDEKYYSYGLVINILNNSNSQYLWIYQIALLNDTNCTMLVRSKINLDAWTKWREI